MSFPRRSARNLAVVVTALLLSAIAPATQAVSAKAGGACAKVGTTSTQRGQTLRCTKVGKRLLWKAVTKPATTPTPAVTTSPAPLPTLLSAEEARVGAGCNEAGRESLPISGPLRCLGGAWAGIAEADDSVASRAFRSLAARYASGADPALAFTFFVDTSTEANAQPIELGMIAGARLWRNPPVPNQPYPVLIGRSSAWLRQVVEAQKLFAPAHTWPNIERQESMNRNCSYAEFYSQGDQPWYLYCFSGNAISLQRDSGYVQVGAHEYTHLAQYAFADDFRRTKGNIMAPWFQEGFAQYVGISLAPVSLGGNDVRTMLNRQLSDVTTKLVDYASAFPAQWGDIYPMGFNAAEALTALFGIGIMEEVCRDGARGVSFDASLKARTGHTNSEWIPILQGYIDSVRAGTPWTLAQLRERAA